MRNSTQYVIAGPKTFRLSSRKILHKWGGNLQNVEKSMREIYESDGYEKELYEKCLYYLSSFDKSIFTAAELSSLRILTQEDQSGAEALIVAYCSEPGQYRELFKNGIKPHSYLAMQLFLDVWPKKMLEARTITNDSGFDIQQLIDCPIPELKKNPFWKDLDLIIKDSDNWPLDQRYYYLAKQTEHSSNYNIKSNMFRMNVLEKSGGKIVISKDEAERFLLTKFSLFPEIAGYHRWVQQCAESGRMLYNLHGHPYTITSYDISDSLKELYAWIPQSSVGEITNIAYTKMQQFIEDKKLQWDMLANTHDSYLKQCPIGEERLCASKGQEFLAQSFVSPIDGAEFSMRSDAQVGFNWRPFHKEKNPLGMRSI